MSKKKALPENYDKEKNYGVDEALKLLPELSTSKFVGSVNIDLVLEIPKKYEKETLKGSVQFPNQFGEKKSVIVFAKEKDAKAALTAGADAAGLEDLMKQVEEGKVSYDVVIATPEVMATIAKLGKVLGPKGLMPNPGSGTVAADVTAAVKSYLSGKQNYKMSEQGVVRARIAKLDMTAEQIKENLVALLKSVATESKKFGAQPFRKITLSPTMGKGVKLDISEVQGLIA